MRLLENWAMGSNPFCTETLRFKETHHGWIHMQKYMIRKCHDAKGMENIKNLGVDCERTKVINTYIVQTCFKQQ